MIRRIALIHALLFSSAVARGQACTQTLPNGLLSIDGNGTAQSPFNSTSSQVWQWVYDSGQFQATGPITITGISVRASQPTLVSAGGNFPNVRVTCSSSPNNYTATAQSTSFAANVGTNATVVFNGAWTTGPITASGTATANWIPIPLTAPFAYNPTLGLDFLVQVEKCATTTTLGIPLDAQVGATGINGGNSYGNTVLCSIGTRTTANNESVPVIKIDYTLGQSPWQVNSTQASLDLNGQSPPPCTGGPITVTTCSGAPVIATIGTTLTGNPFDLFFTASAAVPSNAGGFATPGGQHLNLNISDPTFAGLFAPNFAPIAPAAITASLPAPALVSVQMIVLDPTNAEGFRLSAANQLTTVSSVNVPGPIADNGVVSITTGAMPLCGPVTVPFFGLSYTVTHVCSNGRLMWGPTGSGDAVPLVASAMTQGPSAGAWCDLTPNSGGSIVASVPAPGLFRVSWTSVPYYGSPGLQATFYVEIDTVSGAVTISGITSFLTFPPVTGISNSMFLGLSPGGPGGATDPGQTTFFVGGPVNGPNNATDMVYMFGQAGPLVPGLNALVFTPNASGNYDWTGF